MEVITQFLENSKNVTVSKCKEILNNSFAILPFSTLIIGWNITKPLVNACKDFTEKHNISLYRWQPLLCSDGSKPPKNKYSCKNLNGQKIPGIEHIPEFTFSCPNNENAVEEIISRVGAVLETGLYDGMFLDRIRFPSPMLNPEERLGCFCKSCRGKALEDDIDLDKTGKQLNKLWASDEDIQLFIQSLFQETGNQSNSLNDFFDFRKRSVTSFIKKIYTFIKSLGYSVGLDCFSPLLTKSVGQDLAELQDYSDWIKVMTYGHTMGIAGIPFELTNLINWLMKKTGLSENICLNRISEYSEIPLPSSIKELKSQGLSSQALFQEFQTGKQQSGKNVFAGIELVSLPKYAIINQEQIKQDLGALKKSKIKGIALSWDLRYIPRETLKIVSSIL